MGWYPQSGAGRRLHRGPEQPVFGAGQPAQAPLVRRRHDRSLSLRARGRWHGALGRDGYGPRDVPPPLVGGMAVFRGYGSCLAPRSNGCPPHSRGPRPVLVTAVEGATNSSGGGSCAVRRRRVPDPASGGVRRRLPLRRPRRSSRPPLRHPGGLAAPQAGRTAPPDLRSRNVVKVVVRFILETIEVDFRIDTRVEIGFVVGRLDLGLGET